MLAHSNSKPHYIGTKSMAKTCVPEGRVAAAYLKVSHG